MSWEAEQTRLRALTQEQREALKRHGYNPDLLPRGIAGPPGEFSGWVRDRDEKLVQGKLRNRVCTLDGIEIDGHEGSDLDPSSTACIHCPYEGPNP